MKKAKKMSIIASNILIVCSGLSLCHSALAANLDPASSAIKNSLPGSTQPGVLSNYLSAPETQLPASLPAVRQHQQPTQGSLGSQAAQIKFKLKQIVLENNHVYSQSQLQQIFQDKVNKEISVAELQSIVQDLTNYYRNNGYILSRAILPPQHVQNGIVHIRIVEGFIGQVNVIGIPKGARKIIQAYGDKIAQSRPLQIKVMEHYLRLANEVPGMQVKAVLEPSKNLTGASDLNLSSQEQTFTGSISYDNYGTRYIGPQQDTVNAALNSIFLSGDSTRLTYATTTRPHQLQFYDVSYQVPIGSKGMTGVFGKNNSITNPGLELTTIDINGTSASYYGSLQYPLLRTRAQNLTLDAGVNYLDSQVKSFAFPLYTDHLRTVKFGGNYDFADRFNAANLFGVHIEQGLNVAGASNDPRSMTTSRYGADGIFTKGTAQAARIQPLRGRYSAFLLINGQYSFQPLLAAEQFGFGGSQLGRGYDPAEIIGDRGVGGTIELRADYAPSLAFLSSMQPYVFYDVGAIWNIKDVVGVKSKQSATSTGLGSRFIFTKNFSGNFMVAQPLTRVVSGLDSVGRGRDPRIFFSMTASL